MLYLQFSPLYIPAVIVHGNNRGLEEFDHWYTPAHILDGWNWKLCRNIDGKYPVQMAAEREAQSARPGENTALLSLRN